jgi:hypothetical protein
MMKLVEEVIAQLSGPATQEEEVSHLVRAGVTEQVAMKYSGHRSRSTFMRYNITSERDVQDAAEKLDVARTVVGTSDRHITPVRMMPKRDTASS